MFDNVLGKTSAKYREDANGAVLMQLYFIGGGTAKTPGVVKYTENGAEFLALADDAYTQLVAVPEKTQASGTIGWAYIRGPVADVVTPSLTMTAGHVFVLTGGAIADGNAAFTTTVSCFAVSMETTSTATVHDMWLFGWPCLKTT